MFLEIPMWFVGSSFQNLTGDCLYSITPEGWNRRNDPSVDRKATQRLSGSVLIKQSRAKDG